MQVSADFLPNNESKLISERIKFYKNNNLRLYILCNGSKEGNGKWASTFFIEKIVNEIIKSKHLLDSYQEDNRIENRIKIEKRLRDIINYCHEQMFQESTNDIYKKAHSYVTFDILLFLKDFAYLCHIGHNRIVHIKDNTVELKTKIYSRFEEKFQENGEKDFLLIDLPTNKLGLGQIPKIIIYPIPFREGEDLFLIYTPKFYQSFDFQIGNLNENISKLISGNDTAKIAKNLYELAYQKNPSVDIGIFVIKIQHNINEQIGLIAYDTRFNALRKIRMFNDIKDDQNSLNIIYSLTSKKIVKKGEYLTKEGHPSDAFYVLINGSIRLLLNNKEIMQMNDGPIGEASVVCDMPYFTTSISNSDMEVIKIKKLDFFTSLGNNKDLLIKVQRGLLKELAIKAAFLSKLNVSLK